MNTHTRLTPIARTGLLGWMLFAVVLCLAAFPFAVHAADAAPAVAAPINEATQSWLLNLITLVAASHPWVTSLLAFMGTARLWFKPVSSFIHSIVDLTPSKNDDALLNKVLLFFNENAVGRILAWTLDWLTSVKITKPTPPTPTP